MDYTQFELVKSYPENPYNCVVHFCLLAGSRDIFYRRTVLVTFQERDRQLDSR